MFRIPRSADRHEYRPVHGGAALHPARSAEMMKTRAEGRVPSAKPSEIGLTVRVLLDSPSAIGPSSLDAGLSTEWLRLRWVWLRVIRAICGHSPGQTRSDRNIHHGSRGSQGCRTVSPQRSQTAGDPASSAQGAQSAMAASLRVRRAGLPCVVAERLAFRALAPRKHDAPARLRHSNWMARARHSFVLRPIVSSRPASQDG